MPLIVHTAHVSSKDPDRLDVTAKSGDPVFAPSKALLRRHLPSWGGNGDWHEYARRYEKQMESSQILHHRAWDSLLRRQRVVLVCYCREPGKCHRILLANILGSMGADVRGEL